MDKKTPLPLPAGGSDRETSTISIVDEMQRSYLDYAMSVIVSRALPDVRDGLKPVHRRLLYTMKIGGYSSDKPYRKSARIVGEVMGRFHPHGDQAIYLTLTRLAQDFSMRMTLVEGQGNFGSLDRDPPASMRYTEARLTKAAEAILEEIDFATVDMRPNYDGAEMEPEVLPSRFPSLLVNGSEGIAVGMSTSIPPHNIGEVTAATVALLDNPDISLAELVEIMPGPDFPTGGIIVGGERLLSAYSTGNGAFRLRGLAQIEEHGKNRQRIVISEIPYQVNKAALHERIGVCAREKLIEGITDVRDLSSRKGVRLVVEVSPSASAEVILNQIYRLTPLQVSVSMNLLALHKGRPQVMGLKDILTAFLNFREEVTTRRKRFELQKAFDRAHIVLGLLVAQGNLDRIIPLIRSSASVPDARKALMEQAWQKGEIQSIIDRIDGDTSGGTASEGYRLSDTQAKAILEMPLQRLTALEHNKLSEEATKLADLIEDLRDILASRKRRLKIVRDDLLQVSETFATPRLTRIESGPLDVDDIDLIQPEDMVVLITQQGSIKRVTLDTYSAQRRGGKGRSGMETREDDVVTRMLVANARDSLLFFTDDGKVYAAPVHSLPLGSPRAKGRSIQNFLNLGKGRSISTVLPLSYDNPPDRDLVFVTASGNIRRNRFADFANINASGKIAMRLDMGDSLVNVLECGGEDYILIATAKGMATRFPVSEVRVFSGRTSLGVRAIKLAENDKVISLIVLPGVSMDINQRDQYLEGANLARKRFSSLSPEQKQALTVWKDDKVMQEFAALERFVLVVTDSGGGKLSSMYDYRVTKRGGKGIQNIARTGVGDVVATLPVMLNDELVLVTDQGKLIRCPTKDVRVLSRGTKGVRIFRVDPDERVVSVAVIPESVLGPDDAHGDAHDANDDAPEADEPRGSNAATGAADAADAAKPSDEDAH